MHQDWWELTTEGMGEESSGPLSLEERGDQHQDYNSICQHFSAVQIGDRSIDRSDNYLPQASITSVLGRETSTPASASGGHNSCTFGEKPPTLYAQKSVVRTDTGSTASASGGCDSPTLPETHTVPFSIPAQPTLSKLYGKDAKGLVTREDLFKHMNFTDLDNKATFHRSEKEKQLREKGKKKKGKKKSVSDQDFAQDLCNISKEALAGIYWACYYGPGIDKEHLKTECVERLKAVTGFREVEVGKEKNGADAKMVGDITEFHHMEDKNIGLNILSGDRGFEAIRDQFHHRRVQHLSLHGRHDQNDISIKSVIGGPTHEHRNTKQTKLGRDLELLARSDFITKVHFMHETLSHLPSKEEADQFLEGSKSILLIFRMKEPEKEDPTWLIDYMKAGKIKVYETDHVYKSDAPLFLLEYAALALHFQSGQNAEKMFNVHVEKGNSFTNEVKDRCSGRMVNIYYNHDQVKV